MTLIHMLQQQSQQLMLLLESQLKAARLHHEAITQALEPPAHDIESVAFESAHDR